MVVHINDVLDYLERHPVCANCDGMDSLMDMIHDIYSSYNKIESAEMKRMLREVRSIVGKLPKEDAEELYDRVCLLCMENEQVAFGQGVVVGMQLMTEVNWTQ